MFEELIHKAKHDTKLFVDLLVGFYLDGDALDRQQMEQVIIDYAAKKGENRGQELVQTLRSIAARKGLSDSEGGRQKKQKQDRSITFL